MEPTTYQALYTYDRNWLDKHKPKRSKPPETKRIERRAKARAAKHQESEILIELEAAARRIRTRSDPPRRVTIGSLARELGHPTLYRQIKLSPGLRRAVGRVVETKADFMKRRETQGRGQVS